MLVFFVMTGVLFSQSRSEPAKAEYFGIDQAAKSTFQLWRGWKDKAKAICSGSFIESSKERDIFMTAGHCDGVGQFSIRIGEPGKEGYKIVTLVKVRLHIDSDVMIFKTYSPTSHVFPVVKFATDTQEKSLKFGDKLMAFGFPLDDGINFFEGRYMARSTVGKISQMTGLFYKTTVPNAPGASGGPLFMKTDDGLRMIGVTSHGFRSTQMAYYANFQSIKAILLGMEVAF